MLPAMQVSSHLYEHTVLKIKRPLSLIPHACRLVSSERVAPRVSPLFIIYRSHATDCRGHYSHGPRLEQPQLISLLENSLLGAGIQLAAARNISGYNLMLSGFICERSGSGRSRC